jgi:hypothetical protein
MTAMIDEARLHDLVGGPAATELFTFGNATALLGPSGTVITARATSRTEAAYGTPKRSVSSDRPRRP